MRKQRIWKRLVLGAGVSLMLITATACGGKQEESKTDTAREDTVESEGTKETSEMRTFTDSAGREIELPKIITKVAPTGPVAQTILYTACPDELIGVAVEFSDEAKEYIDSKYTELPKFGQFYGKNANLNMEALIKAKPDVVIDLGQAKDTVKEDMDQLQEQIGIPVVFIEAGLSDMSAAYDKLGELLGKKAVLAELSEYCAETISEAKEITDELSQEETKGVYLALGEEGLNTNAKGSFHAQVLEITGVDNVAQLEVGSRSGVSEVSFEQVAKWNPEVILTYKESVYEKITTDPMWSGIAAVETGSVYKIPTAPYNFVSDPPSVNCMLGIHWLGNLIYPDRYEFSVEDMVEFYQEFYHIELSESEAAKILEHSIRE